MFEDEGPLGSFEDVLDLRARRVLRLLQEQARHETFSRDQPSHHPLYLARGRLAMVL